MRARAEWSSFLSTDGVGAWLETFGAAVHAEVVFFDGDDGPVGAAVLTLTFAATIEDAFSQLDELAVLHRRRWRIHRQRSYLQMRWSGFSARNPRGAPPTLAR